MNYSHYFLLVIRAAKRRLDDWSFYGGVLHVCYAPEYETVQETREKLQDRRKTIAAKVRQYGKFVNMIVTIQQVQHGLTNLNFVSMFKI